mmetsp:Transcript_42986/g.103933  ORF Transcript_42986/g.103933 Transcript_42986/m.103933 type:complete len:789 (-) Transcript_42986:145-2511(-)
MNPSATAALDIAAAAVLETDNNNGNGNGNGQIFIGHNSNSDSNSIVNPIRRNKSEIVLVGEEGRGSGSSGHMFERPAGPGMANEGGAADAAVPSLAAPRRGGRYGEVVKVGSEYSCDDYSNDEDGSSSMMSFLSRATTSEDVSQSQCSTTSLSAASDFNTNQYYWHEPIKVGYAFGPKKMTTMGVVMAEASRVQVIHEEDEEDDDDDDDEDQEEENVVGGAAEEYDCEEAESQLQTEGEKESSHSIADSNNSRPTAPHHRHPPRAATSTGTTAETTKLTSHALRNLVDSTTKNDGNDGQVSTIISLNNTDETDIRHIVRYFRSNCSSAAGSFAGSMSETTTSTPTTAYGSCSTSTTCGNSAVHDTLQKNRKSHMTSQLSQKQRRGGTGTSTGRQRRKRSRRHPVHISFVPLDCDQPLEDQHGGNFDLILHKLTEDILACSLMDGEGTVADSSSRTAGNSGRIDGHRIVAAEDNDASRERVQSLKNYQQNHDYCCLVDDPSNVQTVMSRSDIADVLRDCLRGVYSASGIPVRSPRFVVIGDSEIDDEGEFLDGYDRKDRDAHDSISYSQGERLKEQLLQEEIAMPVIVKPLIAAGTKQSHSMLVALQDSAILKLPCKSIAQEYVNHNATLYKVYVLGDFVSVFDRPSLPNLPDDVSSRATTDLVKFDSQRPYPSMNDFGLDAGMATAKKEVSVEPRVKVTADEVRPIVDVLKKAFGLEMFGFDVLHGEDGEFLVVDVNYFPSYKEVKDFPFLLARYLTQRVLEQRRKKREAEITSIKRTEELPSASFQL